MTDPLATVIVPARNEESAIAGCVTAIAAQDAGSGLLEVFVVDGRSSDGTIAAAKDALERGGFLRAAVLDNPPGGTAAALNVGLAMATAPIVVRVDSRARIAPSHVRIAAELLASDDRLGVVGGGQRPLPRGTTARDLGIARALNNRWTTGLARYRRSDRAGVTDTVWMGAFRTEELRALGGWDEAVVLNEDYELNERYRGSGRVVWFDPRLSAAYLPRPTIRELARQHARYGLVRGRRIAAGSSLTMRHAVVLAAPPVAAAALARQARRTGPAPALLASVAAAFMLDELGSDDPAPAAVRLHAACTTVATDAAWWLGAVAGLVTGASDPGRRRP